MWLVLFSWEKMALKRQAVIQSYWLLAKICPIYIPAKLKQKLGIFRFIFFFQRYIQICKREVKQSTINLVLLLHTRSIHKNVKEMEYVANFFMSQNMFAINNPNVFLIRLNFHEFANKAHSKSWANNNCAFRY